MSTSLSKKVKKKKVKSGSLSIDEQKRKSKVITCKGLNIDIFKNKTKALQYKCSICDKICNNPVELSCDDSDDNSSCYSESDGTNTHDVLYCELCLSLYLEKNNNICPINSKHLNVTYNQARNIRKQINNLYVYCPNNNDQHNVNDEGKQNENIHNEYGCDWNGKLSKLSIHLKSCKYNKIYCNICNIQCIETNIDQHNKIYIVKHISILHQYFIKSINVSAQNKNVKHKNNELSQQSLLSTEFMSKIEAKITDLQTKNMKLKKEFNEWKISYSIETKKKELQSEREQNKLKKQINELSEKYEILTSQSQSQHELINSLMTENNKLRVEIDEIRNNPQQKQTDIINTSPSPPKVIGLSNISKLHQNNLIDIDENGDDTDSVKTSDENDENDEENEENEDNDDEISEIPLRPKLLHISSEPVIKKRADSLPMASIKRKTGPPVLKRSKSTRYFHPKGLQKYHPSKIKWQMYHPKKSIEVWVSKTMGSMTKLQRYPCCGSAKEGSIYLAKSDTEKKRINGPLYVAVHEKEKLPKNWSDNIHIGCKKNKKKNKKNKSFYQCCNGSIGSVGCSKRYICCKEHEKSPGCKTGWGC